MLFTTRLVGRKTKRMCDKDDDDDDKAMRDCWGVSPPSKHRNFQL